MSVGRMALSENNQKGDVVYSEEVEDPFEDTPSTTAGTPNVPRKRKFVDTSSGSDPTTPFDSRENAVSSKVRRTHTTDDAVSGLSGFSAIPSLSGYQRMDFMPFTPTGLYGNPTGAAGQHPRIQEVEEAAADPYNSAAEQPSRRGEVTLTRMPARREDAPKNASSEGQPTRRSTRLGKRAPNPA